MEKLEIKKYKWKECVLWYWMGEHLISQTAKIKSVNDVNTTFIRLDTADHSNVVIENKKIEKIELFKIPKYL